MNGKIEQKNSKGNFIGEYINGNMVGKQYDEDDKLKFEGEYLKKRKQEKNMINMVILYLKENICMIFGKQKDGMEKVKNLNMII